MTSYGRAFSRQWLSGFAGRVDLPDGHVLVHLAPIQDRVEDLIEAYLDLIAWQRAFEIWDRHRHPEAHAEGRVALLPPSGVHGVRTTGLTRVDPTEGLPAIIAQEIDAVRRKGQRVLVRIDQLCGTPPHPILHVDPLTG